MHPDRKIPLKPPQMRLWRKGKVPRRRRRRTWRCAWEGLLGPRRSFVPFRLTRNATVSLGMNRLRSYYAHNTKQGKENGSPLSASFDSLGGEMKTQTQDVLECAGASLEKMTAVRRARAYLFPPLISTKTGPRYPPINTLFNNYLYAIEGVNPP